MKLVTHDGTFHADEVMAYAVLIRVFPSAQLVRTRNEAAIAALSPQDIVFDVGYTYTHDGRMYDHHMSDGPKRDDGAPYSSVGLIWKHYGMECLHSILDPVPEEDLLRIWSSVDRSIVREIDLLDNGVGTHSGSGLPSLVDDCNPTWDAADRNEDGAFVKAAQFAGQILERRVAVAAAQQRAYAIAVKAAETAEDPRIVVLPSSMPWERGIFEGGFEDALYVVYQRSGGGNWYCSAVPPEPGSFLQRKPLPEEWAGLRDAELAAVSSVHDAVFCHPARFVCGAQSYEGIMSLAKMAAEAKPSARPR